MSGETMTAEIEKRPLSMIVNGKEVGPIDVPVGMPMIDFLHHYLNLTGTHFGCGQGVCHACTVLEVQPDGRLVDTRTCIANAHAFNGKTIITIEGQAKTDAEGNVTELTPIQKVNWSRVAWKAARDQMFLKNFMSDTGNSVVHRITELTATEKGTQCLFQLVADLVGDGVRGDDEREGMEEAMASHSQIIQIDQISHGVKNKGRMDDQKNVIKKKKKNTVNSYM